MPEPILHHYNTSPFSEKFRVDLGLKGLEGRSVKVGLRSELVLEWFERVWPPVMQVPSETQ